VDTLGGAIVADRIRVLAVGRPAVRRELDAGLDALGVAHEWATDTDDVVAMCAARHYEVALVEATMEGAAGAVAALDLRGRRLRRSVLAFSEDGTAPDGLGPDVVPVSLAGAAPAVLGLLAPDVTEPTAG
jgi:hypothetical protein